MYRPKVSCPLCWGKSAPQRCSETPVWPSGPSTPEKPVSQVNSHGQTVNNSKIRNEGWKKKKYIIHFRTMHILGAELKTWPWIRAYRHTQITLFTFVLWIVSIKFSFPNERCLLRGCVSSSWVKATNGLWVELVSGSSDYTFHSILAVLLHNLFHQLDC